MTTASTIVRSDTALDTIVQGDCIKVMSRMASSTDVSQPIVTGEGVIISRTKVSLDDFPFRATLRA